MDDFGRSAILFDFYGELLNDRQKEVFSRYVMEDLSLSEIAYECGISKQAVSTMLMRCRKVLEHYEDKLQLVKRFQDIKEIVQRIEETASRLDEPYLSEMRELTQKIIGEL